MFNDIVYVFLSHLFYLILGDFYSLHSSWSSVIIHGPWYWTILQSLNICKI